MTVHAVRGSKKGGGGGTWGHHPGAEAGGAYPGYYVPGMRQDLLAMGAMDRDDPNYDSEDERIPEVRAAVSTSLARSPPRHDYDATLGAVSARSVGAQA